MPFPNASLVASGGRAFAYLFENPRIGLARRLYWGVTLQFEPITYEGERRSCSMTCEWIPWQARSWRELDGQTLSCNYGDQGIEASFYFVAHDPANSIRLALKANASGGFHATMSVVVDFSGYTGEDANPSMPVSGSAEVPFEGVWLRPSSFDPTPSSETEVRSLAADFLNLSDFTLSQLEDGAYVFRPVAS